MNKNLMNFRIPLTHGGAVGRLNAGTGSGAVLLQDRMQQNKQILQKSASLKYNTTMSNPATKS